ncbi:MAG: serine/threonine-protein kinase, partial [Myxococcota bacterium]
MPEPWPERWNVAESYPRSYAHYVLLERLGSGGMSEVDLARNQSDDDTFVRFAVIKRIKADRSTDESFVRMFKDEARITSELHHENIGGVYDFGRFGDEWWLALEYVPGIDVRFLVNTLRERGQRVPVKIALKIVVEVLEALGYAHAKRDTFGRPMGIVHRDVNPRNVMVSIRGEVKLIDFGVAKATDRLEQTRTDQVKGKFQYMAPEQLSGMEVDHRSDLYAAGLLLHELLAGVAPSYGLNHAQVLHRLMSGKTPELPAIPELPDDRRLRAVHDRALAHAVDDRYPSAEAMAADLRAVAAPIGGLPTADQLAGFLFAVDPELTGRLQRKMEGYARMDLALGPGQAVTRLIERTGRAADLHGTIVSGVSGASGVSGGPVTGSSSFSGPAAVGRTGVVAGSVALMSVLSALVASAVVAALLFGAFLWSREPAARAPLPGPSTVAPSVAPSLAPAPEAVPRPIAAGTAAPAPSDPST